MIKWPGIFPQISAMLFLSGAAALIDEHLLAKLLTRVLGSSSEAVAVVLVAFMGGLGLGARFAAKVVSRRDQDPLRRYAAVELGIGLLALAMPFALGALALAFARVAGDQASLLLVVMRFAIAVVVVAAPGFLMGMTYPLILEAAVQRSVAAPPVARFYAFNTLGGSCGVLASTYLLMPALGIWGTLSVAVGCNLCAAAWAFALRRTTCVVDPARPDPASANASVGIGMRRAMLIAAGSGILAFSLEVLYFRVLATIIGSSAYAFGLMLFVFLLGNGIGSRIADHPRLRSPLSVAVFQALVGLTCLAAMPLWDDMPRLFRAVGRYAPSFLLWELTRFAVTFLLLIGPTLAMGAAFGMLLRVATSGQPDAASRVGHLYAVNTMGAIVGALATTFLLAPGLGSERTMRIVAACEVGLAVLALVPAIPAARRIALCCTAAPLALLLLVAQPAWRTQALLSGANVYFGQGFGGFERLRFFEEDRSGGMVAVVERQGVRTLLSNGKFEGNDAFEVRDQTMFALLPLLFVRSHERALNIGVGPGGSLAVISAFPFRGIDAAEISEAVLRAARQEFRKVNHGVLDDPRVAVHVEDGRNFLLRTRHRYDLVVMQLSSIWIGGMADLYNKEFYELIKARLRPGGVAQQWLQLHHIRAEDLAGAIHTMRSVFPHLTLWIGGHQGILVGSTEPLRCDLDRVRGWPRNPRIARVIKQADLLHPYGAFGHLYLNEEALVRLVNEVSIKTGRSLEDLLSRDMRPWLEFSTPRGNVLPDALAQNMGLLRRHADSSPLRYIVQHNDLEQRLLLGYAAHERQFKSLAKWVLNPVVSELATGHPEHLPLLREVAKAGMDLLR